MLQELADESGNQGLKMNNSKTNVTMEPTHQYMSTKLRSRTLKATSTWDRDKENQRRIKAGWTAFAKHRWKRNLKLMRTSSNDIRRGNKGTHHPGKEQVNNRTNKDGKEYVKHHIPGQKNKHLGKGKDPRSQT